MFSLFFFEPTAGKIEILSLAKLESFIGEDFLPRTICHHCVLSHSDEK